MGENMQTKTTLSSKHIYEFYKELEECGVENHGFMVIKDGETLFEEYSYPYSADMPHTLFSVTKSIVSTAAGFAIDEGLLSLDTKIADIFPEYEKCESNQWDELTLRSVLTMQSNKEFTFLQDMTGNYVEMFMKAPFRKEKGFLYSNNDAHMVAAAVQKVSGMNLVDYLMPRLFEPLGIDRPFWETNEIGECIGGTGCYLKLRDLMKIMLCYLQGGKYNGQQIIPEFWTEQATKIQVEFRNNEGYGYLFWINGDICSMTGMFSQIIAFSRKHNAVIGSMNCGIDETAHTQILQKTFMKMFNAAPDEKYDLLLKEYLQNRGEKVRKCEALPKIPEGKKFYISLFSDIVARSIFPQSVIPRTLTCSFAKRPKHNLNEVSFKVDGSVLQIKWKEEEDNITIKCGLDGEPRVSECEIKGYPYKIWAYAYNDGDKLKVVIRPLNTLSTQYLTCEFKNNSVKMQFKNAPDFVEFIVKNAISPDFIKNNKVIKTVVEFFIGGAIKFLERPMTFKTKK